MLAVPKLSGYGIEAFEHKHLGNFVPSSVLWHAEGAI